MAQDTPTVYVHKVVHNKKSKALSIYVTDEPLTEQASGKGFTVGQTTFVSTSRRQQVQMGLLVVKDKKTGKLAKHNQKQVDALLKLKPGTPLPNLEFSDNPVIKQETGKQLGNLVWVVDAE